MLIFYYLTSFLPDLWGYLSVWHSLQHIERKRSEEKKWKSFNHVWISATHRLYSPWNSPGQNTGVGSLSLLQGIFPTQGSNPGLPHCRWILYQLSHKGSPRILEWVACPSSSRYSRPRNQTSVSCIADGFFTNWAIREASLRVEIVWFIFGSLMLPYYSVYCMLSKCSDNEEVFDVGPKG